MSIITDFSDIAKRANLKALEGRPQDSVTAGIPRTEPAEVPTCEGWHVYWAGQYVETNRDKERWPNVPNRDGVKLVEPKTVWSIAENCMVPVEGEA